MVVVLCGTFPSGGFAQSDRRRSTFLDDRGSVPPIPQWFACVRQLKEEEFDKAKSKACLDSILLHPQIQKGRFSLKHYREVDLLTFRVQSPNLYLTDFDIEIPQEERVKVQGFLSLNGNGLQLGQPYESHRETSTWNVVNMFLRSQGRRAGISRTVRLDYDTKTAQVAFKIWDGPPGVAEPLVPPFVKPCEIMNAFFDWSDVDDLSPVDFVKRQMKTKWCGCFSEADVRDDLAKLQGMKFLKEANISVSGSGVQRQISVRLRGNPIRIAKVEVRGYGLFDGLSETDVPPLPLQEGDVYSLSATTALRDSLAKWFAKEGRRVKAYSDVQFNNKGEAALEFSVLGYPDDMVYINGKRFDVAPAAEK
jgi:hypothetical protein